MTYKIGNHTIDDTTGKCIVCQADAELVMALAERQEARTATIAANARAQS